MGLFTISGAKWGTISGAKWGAISGAKWGAISGAKLEPNLAPKFCVRRKKIHE
jgi:hypothetical protein